ncbi:uncharacterized protein G2W53_018588 [Senna tora]|uniref:Uncharacterized protein n=1 Tax=Senna tora TaxID=362788 RepID=A0A834TTD5_9FABA|nr:uncharacterized protein G2W53_018588 [Senna tora]
MVPKQPKEENAKENDEKRLRKPPYEP